MALYDHGPTMVIARALTTAEAGWAVPAVLDHMRVWLTADRGMDAATIFWAQPAQGRPVR